MSFAIVVTGLMLLMVVAVFVWWCASYSKASPAAEASLNQEEESIGVGAIDHPIETFKVRKLHNKELEDTLINNKVYGWTTFSKQPYTLLFRENNDFQPYLQVLAKPRQSNRRPGGAWKGPEA